MALQQVGQAMYESEGANGAGGPDGDGAAPGAGKPDDDVVEGEYKVD